jgi:hypothetical protein
MIDQLGAPERSRSNTHRFIVPVKSALRKYGPRGLSEIGIERSEPFRPLASGEDQFRARLGDSGHLWDTGISIFNCFNGLEVYSGLQNRRSALGSSDTNWTRNPKTRAGAGSTAVRDA